MTNEEARALVETLKDYAEHPSSFTDISPTEADAAADTIDALLNEVEHWKSEAASWEKQASDRVDDALKFAAERDALIAEVERLNSPVVLSEWQKLVTERDALIAEVRDREDVLERAGFRRCDISACNCGSWHQVGGFKARFDEIKEAIAEHVDLNGKTLLTAVQEALAERNALARDAARFDWYFGPNVLKPADFMSEYLRGVREQWTPDQWRAAIDAAMKGASDES
jgi:hypothetical protein